MIYQQYLQLADDVLLAVDTSGGGLKKITRSALVSGLAAGELSNMVEDTSPQLGGNLDTNSQNILIDDAHFIADESGNEQIIFQTTGSAVNQFDITNAASGSGPKLEATGGDSNIDLDIEAKGTGHVTVRGNTNSGAIQFNCESNSHGQQVKAQPHSAAVTNVMLLPAGADSTLVSLVSADTLTNKTLTTPVIAEIVSLGSGDITLDAEADINLEAAADINIPANVGLTFGDDGEKIEGDGTNLTISANNLTVDAAADILLDAGGNDVKLVNGGTELVRFTNNSQNLILKNPNQDKDITISGNDGGANVDALVIDMSAAGAATFNNAITSGAVITSGAGVVVADAGTIGSASDTDAIAIAANGVVTFSQTPVNSAGAAFVTDDPTALAIALG